MLLDFAPMGRFRLLSKPSNNPRNFSMEFNIPAMSCGHCVSAVTQAVKALDAAAQINVDLASKKVVVETSQDREAVLAALADAGYPTQ